jgi:hypothetical protein
MISNPNNLHKKFQELAAMRGIKNNNLLNISNHNIPKQQNMRANNPDNIKSIILDQRKCDEKIDRLKFDRIVKNMKNTIEPEREKFWSCRTNQPYKNILPPEEFKKDYKTQDELVVYKVKEEDKNTEKFKENAEKLKKTIVSHNKELKKIFGKEKMEEFKKEFEYVNCEKYKNIKYDPDDFKDMKDNVVEFYKKAQYEEEKNRKNIDNILENILNKDITLNKTNSSDEEIIDEKYLQRQKKI